MGEVKGDDDDDKSTGKDLTAAKKLQRVHGRISGPARKSSKGNWTAEEDDRLREAVRKYNAKCWKAIAECVPSRTCTQCLHRWQKVLDPDLVKGAWTKEEDDLIIKFVGNQESPKWSEVAKHLPGRIGKQCRERWHNHLNPKINKSPWTKEEVEILIKLHAVYGNKWAEIAKHLQGRTENAIKNHWNCSVKRKLDNDSAHAPPLTTRQGKSPPGPFDSKTEPTGGNFIAEKQSPHTDFSVEKKMDSGENEDSCHLDLSLGYSNDRMMPVQSSGKGNGRIPPEEENISRLNELCRPMRNNAEITRSSEKVSGDSRNAPTSISNGAFPVNVEKPPETSGIDENYYSRMQQKLVNGSFSGLCYEPLQCEDFKKILSSGEFSGSNSYIQQPLSSPAHFSPSGVNEGGMSVSCSSPKSRLRSAAMNFKNMPSIIRKRGLRIVQQIETSVGQSTGEVTPRDKVSDKFTEITNNGLHTEPKSPFLDDDQSLLSPPKSRKLETSDAIRGVGKRLISEFNDVQDSGESPDAPGVCLKEISSAVLKE